VVVHQLGEERSAQLRAAPLTYEPSGISQLGDVPPGYVRLHRSRTLHRRDFDAATRELLGWQMHARAGLRVQASEAPLRVGSVVLLWLGVRPLAVRIPCRVVGVVDEPGRRGFRYGTLPGHPEAGEEQFVLERQAGGHITFTITAVSRPATLLTRLAGPLGRLAQRVMTYRYLRAMDDG
jgi:uncharacterized protein (UPF0548 family)